MSRKPHRVEMRSHAAHPGTAGSWFGRGDIAASLVAIFPLLICYQLLLLFKVPINGADIVSRVVFAICRGSTAMYVAIQVGLLVVFVVWVRVKNKGRTLRATVLFPLIAESAIYGLGLGGLLSLLVHRGLGLSLTGRELASAIGAGVHEELVFRFVLITGLLWLLRKAAVSSAVALAIAFLMSAVLFAVAHHVGLHGEPLVLGTALYRCFAGLAFALIYWYRSLAHAVYAHVIYDLAVFGLS